jgi:protein TonB
MEAWRSKVERIGRLNYPEEAKKRAIFGSLIMDVVLNSDGSVYQLQIKKSSGSKILDDAAIRIVRLAAPFAPLPDNIREETEMLHITRTWIFRSGNRLTTR